MSDKAWEVERDRFGVTFSGPLEIGECIEVVSLADNRALVEALRFYADPENYTPGDLAPMEREVGARARAALDGMRQGCGSVS